MKGALMSVSDRLLLRKRAIIETVNDELKNIAQVEHYRHRCFDNFIVNLLGAIAAYCLFPKKPCINVQRTLTHSLHCSEFFELTLILNRFSPDGIICQHGKVSLQFNEVMFSQIQLTC